LAFRLSEIRQPDITHPIDETIGEKTSRGTTLNGSQIHSIRLPGYIIGVEAIFGAKNERLSIRHDAGSGAEPYIEGTLLAIRRASSQIGLIRGLDKIMT
jgi:4-hydroxy-tetrahydrodipicolinate reductase